MKPYHSKGTKIINFDHELTFESQTEQFQNELTEMVTKISENFYNTYEKLYGNFILTATIKMEPYDFNKNICHVGD